MPIDEECFTPERIIHCLGNMIQELHERNQQLAQNIEEIKSLEEEVGAMNKTLEARSCTDDERCR